MAHILKNIFITPSVKYQKIIRPKMENNLNQSILQQTQTINNNLIAIYNSLKQENLQLKKIMLDLQFRVQDLMNLIDVSGFLERFPTFKIETKYNIAYESDDHIHPRGTRNDNTRYPRFRQKCYQLFGKEASLLDLGCAGGGLVADFLFSGLPAVGIEGSDFSRHIARAEWSRVPNFLFTADITKPFSLTANDNPHNYKFMIVSAWEVLEHIPEELLTGLLTNIYNHLSDQGYFVASVAQFEDADPRTGAKWHVTIKSQEWWRSKFAECGFEIVPNVFHPLDFPRGTGNGEEDWNAMVNPHLGFHIAARKINSKR